MKCDFCVSDHPAAWIYPASDVVVFPGAGLPISQSDWAACEDCHKLLAAGDRDGLARRAESLMRGKWGNDFVIAEMVRGIHAKFFEARLDRAPRRLGNP